MSPESFSSEPKVELFTADEFLEHIADYETNHQDALLEIKNRLDLSRLPWPVFLNNINANYPKTVNTITSILASTIPNIEANYKNPDRDAIVKDACARLLAAFNNRRSESV